MDRRILRALAPSIAGILVAASSPPIGAQESAARFDAPVVLLPETEHIDGLLDFDGDGFLDAVSVWWTSGTNARYRGYRNDGAGRLVLDWTLNLPAPSGPTVNLPTRVEVGDLNGDGRDDFVSAVSGLLHGFLASPGGGPPSIAWTLTEPASIYDFRLADFDGDGIPDVAVLLPTELRIHLTQPGGTPAFASGAPASWWLERILFVAEVNGDGSPDLAFVRHQIGLTTVETYSVVNGIARGGASINLGLVVEPMPVSGDIDGDGDEDIVVFDETQYRVLRHASPGAFTLEPWAAGGPATDLVDVDGDGDLDGACCGGGGFSGYFPSVGVAAYRVALNDGGGTFAPAWEMPNVFARRLAGAVDMDGDGDLDLVAGRAIYYGHGPLAASPTPLAGAGASVAKAVVDPDRDGDPDLAFGLGTYLRNAADGTFAPTALAAAAPPGTTYVGPGYPGDFDGDGDVDLVVETHAGGVFVEMRLLLNNGGGGLADGGPAAAPGARFSAVPNGFGQTAPLTADATVLGDADDDGDLDVVMRTETASRLWLNDGAGFFTAGLSLPVGHVEFIGDWDGDGVADMLEIVNSGAGRLQLVKGLGGGAFVEIVNVNGIFGANEIDARDRNVFADLDGDGDIDVGTALPPFPRLYLNDGTGGIAQTITLPGELLWGVSGNDIPNVLLLVDVDDDGLEDLVSGPPKYGRNAVHIHRRTGLGLTFAPPETQVFEAIAFADVDGDGDPDAITADDRLARNRRHEPPAGGYRLQYGAGLPGAGGMVPTLGESGPFRVGSSSVTHVTGGLGGAPAVLVLGVLPASVPVFGGTLLVDPLVAFPFVLGGPGGTPGAGSIDIPWVLGSAILGASFYKQVGILDLAAPQAISISNGLLVTVGG